MSIFSKLLGAKDVVDMVRDAGDAAVFTKEEQHDWTIKALGAYEPFKVAQRYLTLIVGIPYVSIWVICASAWLVIGSLSGDVSTVKEVATANNDTLGTPFAIILGFYFAGGMVEGGIKAVGRMRNGKSGQD